MTSDTEPLNGTALTVLVRVLGEALRALAASGDADAANRLAARAYVALRRENPELAQRINVLMHGLARFPNSTEE
ncbi:MAG: hypothetical protein KGL16_08405 [Acidobacteriota bacterium]|nr:hypothetical protein [Acidobacteriota bacterium]